jgi:glucose/arabinose dehydrogenase
VGGDDAAENSSGIQLSRVLAMWRLILLSPLLHALLAGAALADGPISSAQASFRVDTVTEGLNHPWGLAFLPNGAYLVTERRGQLRYVEPDGQLHPRPVSGLPDIRQHGQGGLLDVALHPDFASNRLVYLSYAEPGDGGYGTSVARGRLEGRHLDGVEVIFRMQPKTSGRRHFGSRLVFDRDGYLFITLGDRGDRPRAQALDDHIGTIVRLHDDGRIPDDNPFVGRDGVLPEIYSYGHRNVQGATLHPQTGVLWTHEHGPQGGDEINLPEAGVNHGWPVITYGVNYFSGTAIGEGTSKPGMAQPLYQWTPSIAPSGMAFYDGEAFPEWRGDLFVGSLKFRLLVRLEIRDGRIVAEERLLADRLGRIRDVRVGPDGLLYLLTDADDGRLVRLVPAAGRG